VDIEDLLSRWRTEQNVRNAEGRIGKGGLEVPDRDNYEEPTRSIVVDVIYDSDGSADGFDLRDQ
jgi:hypothetical protein